MRVVRGVERAILLLTVVVAMVGLSSAPAFADTTRATMTWDQDVDIDLHIYDVEGNHAWYADMSGIPDASLTHDNTQGFVADPAPEEFVDTRAPSDRQVAYRICYFSGGLTVPETHVTLTVTDPDGEVRQVTVTLTQVSECKDAAMSPDGTPVPPVAEATTATGSTMTDPFTGQMNVWMPSSNLSTLTVERRFVCEPSEGTPQNVRIVLSVAGNEVASENAVHINHGHGFIFQATFPESALQNHAEISIKGDCGNRATSFPLGTLTLIDPSGRITDSTTGLPIVGATVTLFRVPDWTPRTGPNDHRPKTCESPESRPAGMPYSQSVPAAGGLEAEALDPYYAIDPAVNPLVTSSDGRFAWNVAAGSCWYVTVAKTGYTSQTSPMVGVAVLPVLDLDMQLTPTGTPPGTPTVTPSEPDQPTPDTNVRTRLTLQLTGKKKRTASGKLLTVGHKGACSSEAGIMIEKREGPARNNIWMVVKRVTTNSKGAFKTTLPGGKGVYRASYLGSTVGTNICMRSRSSLRRA